MISFSIILIVSLILIYQDLSERVVSAWLIVILSLVSLYQFYETNGLWLNLVLNISYLLIVFLLSWVVMVVIFKRDYTSLIGMGDVLFLLAITPLFEIYQFIYWVIISIIFSLVFHLLLNLFLKRPKDTIPLVGYLSVCLILFEVNNYWF